ncbi:hypothetical protein Tco_1254834 [Tanacetum coccineum]
MTATRINVIELASEEYSQEVLGFSNSVAYGNPSPDYNLIVLNSSPTLTPFGDSDFLLLEEANDFIAVDDEPISREINSLLLMIASPWVSPIHCVPKKGGITVVKNDDNDLIPTRLVTGWREVCMTGECALTYRKLT